jgi:hypothetical protein
MNKIYSTAFLMGGLGNQMFQIAHATAQSWKHGVDTMFYMDSEIQYPSWKPVMYVDNIFKKIPFTNQKINAHRVYEESWNTANLNFVFDKTIEFYGYFQSSKNFTGYESNVKDLFYPDDSIYEKLSKKYPQIMYENTLSVHIRRADYFNVSNILPVVDLTYINECIRLHGNYDYMFIFSDDKDWARNALSYENSVVVDSLKTEEEMWLMSMCKHNVISNSTFSWWGSYLNKNNDKKIYAPSIWFGPGGPSEYSNVYETYWNKIDVVYKEGRLIVA